MRRTTALLLVLGWAAFLSGLGRPAIGDSDEAFYAEAGREMVTGGDWLTPHYSYQPRFQKPILTYWLIAAAYRAAGVSEWAARVWPAVAAIGLALLAAAIARRSYADEGVARLAGAIVATSFGCFSVARLSLPDIPLALFVTLSSWAAFRAWVDPGTRALAWWVLAGAALGLGALTKGPVALVLVALVVVPAAWRERAPDAAIARGGALALAIAVAVATPWYAAMTSVHGRAYLLGFLIGDNVERFATARFNDPRPVWFYLPILAGGMLPWTPLAACAVAPVARRWREGVSPETWRLAWWALAPVLFFTASIGKQPRYILPVLVPIGVLLARGIGEHLRMNHLRRHWLLRGSALATGLLLAWLGALLYRAVPVAVSVEPWLVRAGAVSIGLGGLGLAAVSLGAPATAIPLSVAAAAALALVGLQFGLSPAGHDPVQEVAARVVAARTGQERVGTYHVFVRNLVFYTHLRTEDLTSTDELDAFVSSADRVLCVMRARDADRLDPRRTRVRVLAQVPYVDVSPVRLRAILSPRRGRGVEEVVLVTNR